MVSLKSKTRVLDVIIFEDASREDRIKDIEERLEQVVVPGYVLKEDDQIIYMLQEWENRHDFEAHEKDLYKIPKINVIGRYKFVMQRPKARKQTPAARAPETPEVTQ